MYIGLTPELTELRDELRDYYAKLLTPEVEAELSHRRGHRPRARARSGSRWRRDGWVGIGWPEEYGGQGRSPIEQFIFFDESMRAGAPVPMLTINSVAPTIMRYGSQEQKDFFLPKILAGEIHFCDRLHRARRRHRPRVAHDPGRPRRRRVRHQRPEDLHVARDRRRLHLARGAHRPEREEAQGHLDHHRPDRHARASSAEPIKNMGGLDTNATYYEDVRVPVGNLVGEENQGWNLITNQLNHERVTLCSSGMVERQLEDTIEWAAATKLADGTRVIDQEWVQINLARVHARLEFLQPRQLEGRGRRDAGRAARTRPTRRPSRCSAPSSTSRRSGC